MAMYPKPPAPKKSASAAWQTGGRKKEGMPGVRGSGEMMALKGTGKAKSGTSMPKEKQAGKFAPKKKAPAKGSKY